MPSTSVRAALAVGVALALSASGCGDANSRERHARAERCEQSLAVKSKPNGRSAELAVFVRECAPLYEEATCREALEHGLGTAPGAELGPPLAACAKAYCPRLPPGPEACRAAPVSGSVDRAWVELSHAIFSRDASRDAGKLGMVFLRFFGSLRSLEPPERTPDRQTPGYAVERCERGVELALALPTRRQALGAFYTTCAWLFVENECSAAFQRAAAAESEQQPSIVLLGCRRPYCRFFRLRALEACDGEFVPTFEAVARAWPPLEEAILDLDGKRYADRISRALERFRTNLESRPPD